MFSIGGLMFATAASAAIINVQPDIVFGTSNDLTQDATESDTTILGMDEEQCFVPAVALDMDDGFIPPTNNNLISCHIFHLDPVNNGAGIVLDGRARFDGPILGVISSSAGLDASDVPCGPEGVDYPTGDANRGLEGFQPLDRYRVNGDRIRLQMDVPTFMDQVRVITCCGDSCDPAG